MARSITSAPDPHALLDECLSEAVTLITGGKTDRPRDGQRAMSHDVLSSMLSTTRLTETGSDSVCAQAGTGVGKSLAYAAPAFLVAGLYGQRTVISTESLTLQGQLVTKDLPVFAQATEAILERHGIDPAISLRAAVYKGWSNFSCGQATFHSIGSASGSDTVDVNNALSLAAALPRTGKITIDGVKHDAATLTPLLEWAATDIGRHDKDRSHYPGKAERWDLVSTTTDSCLGEKCSLFDRCSPRASRMLLVDAAVIVTNHTLLSMQAAQGIPTVFGNKSVGLIDHLVVDEAHALPDQVRSAGAREVGGFRIARIAAKVRHALQDEHGSSTVQNVVGQASAVADAINIVLSGLHSGQAEQAIPETLDPTMQFAGMVTQWFSSVLDLLPKVDHRMPEQLQRSIMGIRSAVEQLDADMRAVAEPRNGYARWTQLDRHHDVIACVSPVDVGGPLAGNLYAQEVPTLLGEPLIPEHRWIEATEPPMYRISVTMASATLISSFPASVGLPGKLVRYQSPFQSAYDNSCLYIPRATDQVLAATTSAPYGRAKFDVRMHAEWAKAEIEHLVGANKGSALVLATTAANGRTYADWLRRTNPRLHVIDQWSSASRDLAVHAWREDHDSVLVGTRSMFTGVDAPGETCSLVVIDRVPRKPQNPVDEARTEALMERLMIDVWRARGLVYVADASMVLEQGAGRLIRSVGDSGMLAILDPRLLKGAIGYSEPDRLVYTEGIRQFGTRVAHIDEATHWLSSRRQGLGVAA